MQKPDLIICIQNTVSMELEQKVRYAFLAFAAASLVLAGLGVHAALHLKVLEGGPGAD